MKCDPRWLAQKEQKERAMQRTLNEFMVELLQGRYDTPRKPATYEDLL